MKEQYNLLASKDQRVVKNQVLEDKVSEQVDKRGVKPSAASVKSILGYSKALRVENSESLGTFRMVMN